MSKPFHCSLVTPERSMLDAEATYADVPTHDGQMGFMADHAPALVQLGKGRLTLTLTDRTQKSYHLEGGFAQMNGNRLTLLSEKASEA